MADESRNDARYVLGTSKEEQSRLKKQGDAIGPTTQRLIRDAGIGEGMRVLDVGCGIGDVTLLAAEAVGSSGEVVGIDREPKLLETARERFKDAGIANVSFVDGDFREVDGRLGKFDAVVGRLVLMYQADPTDALRHLATLLHAGGVAAFLEYDSLIQPASPIPLPLHLEVRRWIWGVLEKSGAETEMGFKLYGALRDAGYLEPTVFAEAVVQTPSQRYPVIPLIRVLLPRLVEFGIATEDDVDIETLEQRLASELEASGAPYVGKIVFGAWARTPE